MGRLIGNVSFKPCQLLQHICGASFSTKNLLRKTNLSTFAEQGRRCGKALKLQVTGSLGLLGMAKHHGIIAAARPLVTAMSNQGNWYREDLVAQFLTGLGE